MSTVTNRVTLDLDDYAPTRCFPVLRDRLRGLRPTTAFLRSSSINRLSSTNPLTMLDTLLLFRLLSWAMEAREIGRRSRTSALLRPRMRGEFIVARRW